MPPGTLIVEVIEGRDLKSPNLFQKFSPFVSVTLLSSRGDETKQTVSHRNAGSNPNWRSCGQDALKFLVENEKTMLFKVMESSEVEKMLGSIVLEISPLFASGSIDRWLDVVGPNGKSAGNIHVAVRYESMSQSGSSRGLYPEIEPPRAAPAVPNITPPPPYPGTAPSYSAAAATSQQTPAPQIQYQHPSSGSRPQQPPPYTQPQPPQYRPASVAPVYTHQIVGGAEFNPSAPPPYQPQGSSYQQPVQPGPPLGFNNPPPYNPTAGPPTSAPPPYRPPAPSAAPPPYQPPTQTNAAPPPPYSNPQLKANPTGAPPPYNPSAPTPVGFLVGGPAPSPRSPPPAQPSQPPQPQQRPPPPAADAHRISVAKSEYEIMPDEITSLGECLGQGSFGAVYKGRFNGAVVAVKKPYAQTPNAQEMDDLRHEVEILVRMRHPNCVTFYGACTTPGQIAIVTELLSRGSLFDVLGKPEKPAPLVRLRMARDCAAGVLHLHRRGIVHRDLKSLNMLVGEDYTVKVADYGLAMLKERAKLHSDGHSGKGTPCWMAPELFHMHRANEASDVYALAIIFWEILCCEGPFKGIEVQVVTQFVMSGGRPPVPEPLPSGFSVEYISLMTGCWEHNPSRRLNLRDVLSVLESMCESADGHTL